ncbi:PD40 domain-containing protein [Armatimonas rosea]|uniref:Tol biopolymer transport system component n=1 Tax=Armatimonas rosea TaxID=685828 RepID=A0A7W9SUV3_ARMRO|nr:PD40 domain-containing protein [Armatimonas rosea]MBB6053246.1 Tol biopolymer transport system component [Armatimonas rosea]
MSRTFDLSPDGRWLVFSPWGGKHLGLFLFDLVAREVKPLTAPGIYAYHPAFTPDGSAVIYSRTEKLYDDQSALWRVEVGSGENTPLLSKSRHFHGAPTVTPDGSRIVFMYSHWIGPNHTAGGIASVRIDGTDFTTHSGQDYRCAMNPHVALDNQTVAFWAYEDENTRNGIATVSLRTKAAPVYLYTKGGAVCNPRFAPVGTGFTFIADPQEFRHELFYADAPGAPARALGVFKKSGTSPRNPAFSPDGKTIYFLNDSSLWRIQTDGIGQECLADDTLFSDPPSWKDGKSSRRGCLSALAVFLTPGKSRLA